MIKQVNIIILLLQLVIVFPVSSAFSLDKLSGTEMKRVVAQSGISVAVSQVIVFNSAENIRLINPDETNSYDSYLELGDIESMTTTSCGLSDVDGDDERGYLSIDMGTINDRVYLFLNADDLETTTDMTIGEINYCGTDIGSLKIDDQTMSSLHLYIGPHGNGIDAEWGFATRTDLVEFQYNDAPTSPDTGKLSVTGTTFANSFAGTESDPSTWEAAGEFQIGDIENGNPVVIDMSSGNGDNPNAHLSLQIGAIEGAMRIENINFGGNDAGQVIMDGINFTKFDIEFPGRGLGRP